MLVAALKWETNGSLFNLTTQGAQRIILKGT